MVIRRAELGCGAERFTTYSQYAISSSVNGISVQKIYFQSDVNLSLAISQVVAATNAIRALLPAGTQPPIVVQYSASAVPVLQIALSSDNLSQAQLYDYGIYRLRQILAPIHGVTLPTPAGGKYRQIMVDIENVTQRLGRAHMTLPGTTLAFEAANIYAHASGGYVLKRYVDIGDHVKAAQLLAEITAAEVEAQVAQYQNSLQQAQATLRQNEAQRTSNDLTSKRISILANEGWATKEQGDVDWYNYVAQSHATNAAQYNAAAMQAQLSYYNQQKIYQQVVASFDGVITQRNIDVGSLVTADAAGGTADFSMNHSHVIRVWVYVPQDDAFGVKPGIDAVLRVPAMPDLTFHGTVTRIADALEPGTRTLLTEVDVPNPDSALQPGMYCTVELKIPRTAPALIVPASASSSIRTACRSQSSKTASCTCTRSRSRPITALRSRSTRVSSSAIRSYCNRQSICPMAKSSRLSSRLRRRHSVPGTVRERGRT
jgi:RND family efflux transporter MFP subunit